MRHLALLLTVVGLYGCALPCDAIKDGEHVCLVVESSAEWAQDRPALAALLEKEITTAAESFGGSFSDLDGWTVKIIDDPVSCYLADGLGGCTNPREKTITLTAGGGKYRCLASTLLAHEVGHAVIGAPTWDVYHRSARWTDTDAWIQVSSKLLADEGIALDMANLCVLDVIDSAERSWPRHNQF